MGPSNQMVTSVSLRTSARRFGRCSAELAALGPDGAATDQGKLKSCSTAATRE